MPVCPQCGKEYPFNKRRDSNACRYKRYKNGKNKDELRVQPLAWKEDPYETPEFLETWKGRLPNKYRGF
jgi:hypothetical protein